MNQLLLIVTLGGEQVALPAAAVESVVEIDYVTPVPRAARHVAGLSALRSRVLTVIDGRAALELDPAPPRGICEAIVVEAEGHPYAILVDAVEDVIQRPAEPQPLSAPPQGGWARVGRAMVEVEGRLFLLVDPAALIEGPPTAPAEAA